MNVLKIEDVYRFVPPIKNLGTFKNGHAISNVLYKGRVEKWRLMNRYVEDYFLKINGNSPMKSYIDYSIIANDGLDRPDGMRKEYLQTLIDIGVFVLLTPEENIGREFGLI